MKKRTMFSWGVAGMMNGRNAMKKRRKKSQDYYSLSKQKMIGAAGGIFVAVLGAVPFVVSVIGIFVIDYGSN